MKQFNGFEDAQKSARYSGSARLPKGGYVCKIPGVKFEQGKEGNSDMLRVQFDVAEGDLTGFFKKQYDASNDDNKKYKGQTIVYCPKDDGSEQDGWTKNTFARWTNALEDSNDGYKWDWDEKKWKNKLVGLVFGETGTVIDGKEVVYTDCRYPVAVKEIREGTFKEAPFKAKNGYGGSTAPEATNDGPSDFMNVPDGLEDELPFK